VKNFIVSYDLNGPTPTHAQMDKHLKATNCAYGRILETVWYVKANSTSEALYNYIAKILSENDLLVVVEGATAMFGNTLVNNQELVNSWNNLRAA